MSTPAPGVIPQRGVGPTPIPGQPYEIAEGVLRLTAPNPSLMTGPGTNTYLVGTEQLVIIDPGPDDPNHRRRIIDVVDGRPVTGIAVTHTHPDHAPGARRLAQVVGAPRLGYRSGPDFEPDRHLVDGDLFGSGHHQLRVLHTPGHASDHCCFLLISQGLLFTGDHLMEGSTVVIRPPDGSVGDYLASLERLVELDPPLQALAPGHGRVVADPIEAITEVIEHRLAREELILPALRDAAPASAASLRETVYPGLEKARHDIATATLWGHLQHLTDLGRVRRLAAEGREPDIADLFAPMLES